MLCREQQLFYLKSTQGHKYPDLQKVTIILILKLAVGLLTSRHKNFASHNSFGLNFNGLHKYLQKIIIAW